MTQTPITDVKNKPSHDPIYLQTPFDLFRWIPLIEAKLLEFEGTAEMPRLRAPLLALRKRQKSSSS